VNPSFLVAAASSVLFGTADFTGGVAARRTHAPLITAYSGLGALALLFIGLPFTNGAPGAADLAWGAIAGVCGAVGATLIYVSIAMGPVALASPVFCVIGLAVPVLFGVVMGERPSPIAWAGVALAVCSIPLVSMTPGFTAEAEKARARHTLLVASAAGIVVGGFLIATAHIRGGAGLWPLILARGVGMALLFAWLAARRHPLVPPAGSRRIALGVGVLDSAGNLSYWIAVQTVPIALAATLVSLAPATTVLLARLVHGEKWSMPQRAGLVLALVAGAMISHG
jgi:drug/metabolite transporter (DMT)-like permease